VDGSAESGQQCSQTQTFAVEKIVNPELLIFSETLRLPKIGYVFWYFFGENFAVAYQRM
jgi:hypothetical protein